MWLCIHVHVWDKIWNFIFLYWQFWQKMANIKSAILFYSMHAQWHMAVKSTIFENFLFYTVYPVAICHLNFLCCTCSCIFVVLNCVWVYQLLLSSFAWPVFKYVFVVEYNEPHL